MPPGGGNVGSTLVPSGGVMRAANATSPRAFTVGRPRNCLILPMSALIATPTLAAALLWPVTMFRTTICSVVLPSTWARNATQPLPAAEGSPTKLGPAKTPPPGAPSPSVATDILEAPRTGATQMRQKSRAGRDQRVATEARRITTGEPTSNDGAR